MYATGATAVPPYTSTHLSAAFTTLASAAAPAVTDPSVAASARATLSPRAAPVPQTTYGCSATSNTAMPYSPSSRLSAAAANAAPGSPVWFPAVSSSSHPSSVTAVGFFTDSSCTRQPAPRVTPVRRLLLNSTAAAFDSCTPHGDPPSSPVPSITLPFPSGPPDGPASSCSPLGSRVPSLTVAAASSSAARVTTSFRSDSSASFTPDTDVPSSPQAGAATLSATDIGASPRSYTGAAPFVGGVARRHPTASVLYTSPGSASSSHSSVPRICRGVPLLPFIRSRRPSTLPHMQLFGIKEKSESSFSRTGIRKAAKRLFTVEPTPICRGPLVPEQAVEVCEGDNSNTETAHVQSTAAQLQSAKAGFFRTITTPFPQRQGAKNGERLPPQQKAHRYVQTVLHYGYFQQLRQRPPPQQVKQCIPGFGIHSRLKTETVSTKVVEEPQEQQWVPQKFTSASCPHLKPQLWSTHEPGKKYTQPDRSQSPGQAKQQHMRSQPQEQQEAAKQVQQQQLIHRQQQQQQQQSPRQHLERLHEQQERLHSLQQQKLSQQQQHGVTRRQQTNPGEQPLKKEMSCHSGAVASAHKPLRTSNNNMREQLICYVCLSAATAAVGKGKIPVTSSHRDGLLSFPTSSSAVTAEYTGKMVSRIDITATNCLQAPALSEIHGHSSKGFSSLAVSTKGYKGGPCDRTNTRDNVSSGSRCKLPGRCSGTIGFGDPPSVGGYLRKNSVVISGSARSGGITSTPTNCRFYEVGGLVLCQKCALLRGVHTAQQVNALLEEALCFLAEEAGVNFNHPALLELHGIALGSSSGYQGSMFSSPHDTTDISRSGSESGRMHSGDSNPPHRKNTCTITEAKNTSSKQPSFTASCSVTPSSSRSKQTSSTASSSVSSSSSSDDDGSINRPDSPTWECATINGDMNTTRHRRSCDRIMAVSQGDRARQVDTADNRRNSVGERPSKTDVQEAGDSQLSSGNTAWEFPFYVEATSLSALLPPSGMEAAPAAVRHPAADSLVAGSTSRLVGNGRRPWAAAVATHRAATAGHATGEAAAAAISEPVVPASHSSACLPADACRAAPPPGARFGRASACICNSNKRNHCMPPLSVSDVGVHSIEYPCHVASRHMHPFEQSAVFLQQRVPERIVFGLCETLKVYLPQASVGGVRATRSRSGLALRQMGWSGEAATTRTAAADELTGTESSADVATNTTDQDASRKGEAGPSALPLREAPSTRRAPTEVTSRDHKALAVLKRHIEPCRCMKEQMSGLAAVETAELSKTTEEVPAREFSQLHASGEMEFKPPAAVSADPSEEVEMPSARAHAAIQVNGFAPSAGKGERMMIGLRATYNKSVLHAACKRPSSEARRRTVQSETAGVECKEAHPARLEGHIRKRAADAADEGKDRVKRPTDTSPTIKTQPEGLRHAEEEVFARGAGLQSAVTNDNSSQSGAAGAREAVGGNQAWGQPRTVTVDGQAGQRELLGDDSLKEGMTSTGFPDRAAAPMPADSASPSLPRVALHTNGGLLRNEECKNRLPHGKEDYARPCRGKQAATAGGTEASLVRARVEDAAPPLLDASFQPAVHRVAVARGLPEAVFLAHLGHELLHAYIWCTTDVAAASATVPAEPKRAEANYLSAGNTKGLTPGVPEESSGFPLTGSAASGRVASHKKGRPADDAALKPARGIRSERQQHANGCGNRLASAPSDTCTGEYMWGVRGVHSIESASQFYVRTGKEPEGAFTDAERSSVSRRRSLAVAELVRASCPNLTNDGVDKGKKRRTRNHPGVKTHPQRRCSSAVPSSVALSTCGKLADTRNRKLQAQQQQPGEQRVAADAAPLHRFPPLELALEEGLCNCVAAALLERRASASYARLQKLLAAADVWRRKRQATTVKAGNSYARQSVSGTASFVTRFPVNYDGLGGEESQAVQQNKIVQSCCYDEHMLPVAQQQQPLHSKHQVEAMHKEQQQRPHRKCESDLKQQQQQQQLHHQLRQQHTLGELQDCAQQHRQRNSPHPQPRMSPHKQERELEGDRFSERQQRTQDNCYNQPLRRQPEPQDAHVGRLLLREQLQGNDLPDEILQHEISVCLHELEVIQLRLRLTETDSHAVYGKSYKMLRILVKRFGLRTVLEVARKRRLQQLVNHCATILDA